MNVMSFFAMTAHLNSSGNIKIYSYKYMKQHAEKVKLLLGSRNRRIDRSSVIFKINQFFPARPTDQ